MTCICAFPFIWGNDLHVPITVPLLMLFHYLEYPSSIFHQTVKLGINSSASGFFVHLAQFYPVYFEQVLKASCLRPTESDESITGHLEEYVDQTRSICRGSMAMGYVEAMGSSLSREELELEKSLGQFFRCFQ